MTNYNGDKKFNLVCPNCKKKLVKFIQSTGTNENQKIYQCFNCNQLWNNRKLREEDKMNKKKEIIGSSVFRFESNQIQEYYILRENKNGYFVQNKERNKAFTISIKELNGEEWSSDKKELIKNTINNINLEINALTLEKDIIVNQIKKHKEFINSIK